VSGGASSWTTGKGSFGITAKTPAGSSAGAKGGSWVAGSGSFGMKAQPGGICHESGSGSMGTRGTAHTQIPAAEGFAPAALPGLPVGAPAAAGAPGRARFGVSLASRSPAGGHPGSGVRLGASSGSRTGGSRSAGSKPASLGAHSRAGSSHGSGAGSSSSHAKTQPPSAFTPSRSSARGGMRQPGSGRETIP
jgi:hypothetical protein